MDITRRDFLKWSGVAGAGLMLGTFGFDLRPIKAYAAASPPQWLYETISICGYCSVGCGMIVGRNDALATYVEGDADNPVNRGALCSKGAASAQLNCVDEALNPRRLTKPLYRGPGESEWTEVSWDSAISEIALKIKATRDATFVETEDVPEGSITVNRCNGIASLGSAAFNNEACYLLVKLTRALGLVYIEHQARICHSSTVAALAESFGRGAMTNHWIDMKNADVFMIIGSNAAENHPVAFKWINEALKNGAKLISVDPRFTRTSAKADIYAQMRSGTDIAFIGGMINYALDKGLYNEKYVKECTNALFKIDPDFKTPRELDGLFSGYDPITRMYDTTTWYYQVDGSGNPILANDLTDPDCVFQKLIEQYSAYDVGTVCSITGTHPDVFRQICETYCSTYLDAKSATILYAMGTTQHTYGAQMIRAYSMLQFLLGNVGVAGGGINALRGWSNVQGSTDINLLMHIIPAYNPCPQAVWADKDWAAYKANRTPATVEPGHSYTVRGVAGVDPVSANWWQHRPKYVASLLKAWWPDDDVDVSYQYLPKRHKDCTHISLFEDMLAGTIKGLLCLGQNPAVAGPDAEREREALEKLDWLVVCDLFKTEVAEFWRRPGVDPSTIGTEVFLLPGAAFYEKEGSLTSSGRWHQWRWKACDPPGEAKDELEIIRMLGAALKGIIGDPQIADLSWDYSAPADPLEVAKELNGYDLATGKLVPSFGKLKSDGSTACGNWLFCNSFVEYDDLDDFEKANHAQIFPSDPAYTGNRIARRYPVDVPNKGYAEDYKNIGLYSYWAWDWPVNRRIIYNRASTYQSDNEIYLAGDPLASQKWVIRWNDWNKTWEGDVPDHGAPPGGVYPFIMKAEGHGHLMGIKKLADGPFPEHYEPRESPVSNLMSSQQYSPVIYEYPGTALADPLDPAYPIVATTYRLSEHMHGGGMTRNQPWLCELMPEPFIEMSEELAAENDIQPGDWVIIRSIRGSMRARACVTKRFRPYILGGDRVVHHVGIPWHWGYCGICTGDSANVLTPPIGDANTRIPEYKAFVVNIEKE